MKLAITTRWVLATTLSVGLASLLSAHGDKPWPVPKEAAARKNPVSAGHESLAQGKSLYEKNCASCHGPEGKADGPMAAHLPEKPSNFTDGHMMGEMTDGGIFWKMSEGRGPMPSFKKLLTDEERWHLVNYLRALAHSHHDESHGQGALLVAGIAQDQPSEKQVEAERTAVEKIEAVGGVVRKIAATDDRLGVDFHIQGSSVVDNHLAPLKDLRTIIWLDLGNTSVTDSGLAYLETLTTLTKLHLEKTKITEAGLKHLKNLKSLSYLNLYGTAVSDAGLSHLRGLSNLKKLFLWQTKVTRKGVAGLQKALRI